MCLPATDNTFEIAHSVRYGSTVLCFFCKHFAPATQALSPPAASSLRYDGPASPLRYELTHSRSFGVIQLNVQTLMLLAKETKNLRTYAHYVRSFHWGGSR